MSYPKSDSRTLARFDECIRTTQASHTDDEIRAAARQLGIEHMLPEPLTLPLFNSKDGYGAHTNN